MSADRDVHRNRIRRNARQRVGQGGRHGYPFTGNNQPWWAWVNAWVEDGRHERGVRATSDGSTETPLRTCELRHLSKAIRSILLAAFLLCCT